MTTNNQVERILFTNLIDQARNHSFALVSVTLKDLTEKENRFRHTSLIGKLKKKGCTVYDFNARIENSWSHLPKELVQYIFVIANDSIEEVFREEIIRLTWGFNGCLNYIPSFLKFNCYEELTDSHWITLTKTIANRGGYFFVNNSSNRNPHAPNTIYENIIDPRFMIEGKIKPWPLNYKCISSQSGFDARLHWRTMYEEANDISVKRTARKTIAMETEFHDGALIGVDDVDVSTEDTRRQAISLRAFLRIHFAWSRQEIKSSFKFDCIDHKKVPLKFWYVCDTEDTGTLLPDLYQMANKLGIDSFLWISTAGSVDKIYVTGSLPEGLSSKEALAKLDTDSARRQLVSGYQEPHPTNLPKRIMSFYLGNQFTPDRRSEIHGVAENQGRYLKDKRLAEIDWRDIELTEENLK